MDPGGWINIFNTAAVSLLREEEVGGDLWSYGIHPAKNSCDLSVADGWITEKQAG